MCDLRLPDGGSYVVGELYNVTPGLFGRTREFATAAGRFGTRSQWLRPQSILAARFMKISAQIDV